MKNIFLILSLLLSISVSASFLPESKINGEPIAVTSYSDKSACEAAFSETCYKIPFEYNHEYHELVDQMIDDETKPIYEAKSNVVACIDEADCVAKEAAQVCTGLGYFVVRVEDNSEVYCTKVLGYEQKLSGDKIIAENASKKSTFEAAKAAKDAKDAAIAMATKAIDCGKRVIAMLVVQNASKGLDTTQIKAMNASYSTIKDLLETGSLTSAREEILASTADGVLVTETDKTVLVAELDLCKP